MRLEELRELPLPPTRVAEGAWELARRRRRRNTVASATVAAVLVGTTAVAVGVVRGGDHGTGPPPAPAGSSTPSPTPSASAAPTITDLPDFAALARTVPSLAATNPTYLSDNPVHRAVLAILPMWGADDDTAFTVVDVLGDDGRWRYVDVPGLVPTHDEGGYQGPVLDPTSLSADGTHLAFPQPDRVVVVDLTTGDYESYDLPGPHVAVVWQDADHLVVTEEGAERGRVLDLADGSVSASSFTASTGFALDGSWVTWGYAGTLVSSDGTRVQAEVANSGGLQRVSPLVDTDVAVGLGGLDLEQGGHTVYKNVAGVAVVDRHSGELCGFLYTEGPDTGLVEAHPLGLDGDTVTFAVGVSKNSELLLVRWNWRTGAVTPVEVVKAGMVSGAPG